MSQTTDDDRRKDYQAFIEQKHQKWQTPDEILASACKELTGTTLDLASKSRVTEGESNEVYFFSTKDGQPLVVRVSHSEHPHLKAEKWAIDMVKEKGVPAPEVLGVGNFMSKDKQVQISIQRRLPGVPLDKLLGNIPEAELRSYLAQTGDILSAIHKIKVEGFGWLDENGRGRFDSWEEEIFRLQRDNPELRQDFANGGLDPSLLDQAYALLETGKGLYKDVSPVLLHQDIGPKHILVEGDKVTGLIDFETVLGGDPVLEFARYDLYHGSKRPTAWLMEGYKNKAIFDNNFDAKMKLYRVYMALGLIDYYLGEENQVSLQHILEELKKDLA